MLGVAHIYNRLELRAFLGYLLCPLIKIRLIKERLNVTVGKKLARLPDRDIRRKRHKDVAAHERARQGGDIFIGGLAYDGYMHPAGADRADVAAEREAV